MRSGVRWLPSLILALALHGCASVDIRPASDGRALLEAHAQVPPALLEALARAADCCASPAQFRYADVTGPGSVRASIDTQSPAYRFDGGKSFFAAWRIAALPRPFSVDVSSHRTAMPGTAGGTAARVVPDLRQLVFAPVVLVLDDAFRVRRVIEPGAPSAACTHNAFEEVYGTHFDVAESAADAAYLVVTTTDAWRARDGDRVCGLVRHGLSPIGEVSMRFVGMDFADGRILHDSSWTWHPGARGQHDVGLLATIFRDPGRLLLGETAVHFLQRSGDRYASRLRIPYDRLVSAHAGGARGIALVLTALDENGASTTSHTFELSNALSGGPDPAAAVLALLTPRIRPAGAVERIGLMTASRAPALEFLAPTDVTGRVGRSAVTGGMVAALPCGLCQTGACTPDILVSCGALFTVGSVLGAIVGVGAELATSRDGASARPPSIPAQATRAVEQAAAGAARERLDPGALLACIAHEAASAERASWVDQGRGATLGAATLVIAPEADTRAIAADLMRQGFRHALEASLTRIALVSDPRPGQEPAEVPVRLRIEVDARFIDAVRGDARTAHLAWQGEPHRFDAWQAVAERLAGEALEHGCAAIARDIVAFGRRAWIAPMDAR